MTVVVLALDALDAGLVDYFDAEEYRLRHSAEMETYAHTQDDPYTPEVWATVATGEGPEEHGITGSGTSEWDNPILEWGSKITGRLPVGIRGSLGSIARSATNSQYDLGKTDSETVFDGHRRVVHKWPGVAAADNVVAMWNLMGVDEEGQTRERFERNVFGTGVQQASWAQEMLNHDVALAGTHIHTLDVFGHAYALEEKKMQYTYERVAQWISRIEEALGEDDELLLLSDHGIKTSFYDGIDEREGHSFRAYASTTADVDPPESVYDVAAWIERRLDAGHDAQRTDEEVSFNEENLKDLGYIE